MLASLGSCFRLQVYVGLALAQHSDGGAKPCVIDILLVRQSKCYPLFMGQCSCTLKQRKRKKNVVLVCYLVCLIILSTDCHLLKLSKVQLLGFQFVLVKFLT